MLRSAAVLMTAGALVAVGTSSALAGTSSSAVQTVSVVGNGSSVHLSKSSVTAGTVRFTVSTTVPIATGGDSEITLFKLRNGATLTRLLADFRDEFTGYPSIAARGTRELVRDASFHGLADVVQGFPMSVTENLTAGTYYLMDAGTAPPTLSSFTRFTVRPAYASAVRPALTSQFTVQLTSADRFVAPRNWAHKGTVTVANVSDTIHFMNLVPVKAGTTDKQVQAYFDSGVQTPPPFALQGPSGGSDVLSPGASLQLTYNLPAGTYVLLCFVADDVTGMPHAVMGMHKVVVLH
jgi:hypothetical protein